MRRKPTPALRSLLLLLMLSGGFVSGCGILGPDDEPHEPKADELTVLFIGSSYLEFNDVPRRFQEMARKAGREVYVKSQTRLGQPLAFHASNVGTTAVIRERDWDFAEASTDVPCRWKLEADLAEDLRDVASRTVLDDLADWRIDW
jgi:hypothetical protein